jgi:RHS repeat-associated protein
MRSNDRSANSEKPNLLKRTPSALTLLAFCSCFAEAQTIIPDGTVISADATWSSAGNVYVLGCGVGVNVGVTLTISPGVIVKGQPCGSPNLILNGQLIANGTAGQPIAFTSIKDDTLGGDTNGDGSATTPAANDWFGFRLLAGSSASLSNVIARYGSTTLDGEPSSSFTLTTSTFSFNGLSVYVNGGTASVTGSTFNQNQYGVIINAGATPTVTGNTFSSNTQSGVQLNNSTGGSGGTVSNNIFTTNLYGIETLYKDPLTTTITNNTFTTSTGQTAIQLVNDFRGSMSGNSSTGTGLNGALVSPFGALGASTVWGQTSMPYVFGCGVGVNFGVTLMISPGVIVKGQPCGSPNLILNGQLIANGTAGQPIAFTSIKDDTLGGDTNGDGSATTPAPNDWFGFRLLSGSSASLSNVIARYGSTTLDGEPSSSFTLTTSTFSFNGLSVYVNGGTASVTGSTFHSNSTGVQVGAGATPHISNSYFYADSGYGVINADCPFNNTCSTTPNVDARNNWWGSAAGPWRDLPSPLNGSDRVSYHVTTSPYNFTGPTKNSPPNFLGGAGTTVNPNGSSSEPVDTATGNYYTSVTDLTAPGRGLSFSFTRAYNTGDSYSGPFGPGWTHSYNLVLTVNADSSVSIKERDGGVIAFAPSGSAFVPQTTGVFDSLAQNPDGSYTLTRTTQTKVNFTSAGQLASIVDRNGNTQSFTYNAGRLATIIDSSGRAYTLLYDGNGHITSIADPISRTIQYSYDSTGRLISVVNALGGVTQYTYDPNNCLLTATDPRGNVYLQNTYDSAGRVIQQQNARNFTTSFAYDTPVSGTTTITDPLGNATMHVYDSNLQLIAQVDPLGETTSYVYGASNLKSSITDPLGRAQNFTYDGRGNTTSVTDPNSKTTTFAYDAKNNLLSTTDRLGRTTTLTYDSRGNLLSSTDPAGNLSTFTYDSFGEVLTATNARSFTTSFLYDSAGDLIKATDGLGGTVNMTYDTVGRLLSTQNQLAKISTRSYDANNRLLSAADPIDNTTQFQYDANGNLTKITDANGNHTQYSYDATNKLATVTDAIGGITQYQYNGNTDLTQVTDANGHSTTYAYDAQRRPTAVTDPLGRQKHYSYDAAGNTTGTIDGNNKTNNFGYDTLNRLVSLALSDGKNVAYTYDAVGNRLTMADWRGTTSYAYDLLNRATSVSTPDGKTVSYSYDAAGNRATLTYPDSRIVQYSYDGLNRLSQVTDWASKATTYSYDAASNLTAFAHPNGAASTYQYDAANRLLSIVNQSVGKTLSSFSYILDKVGNRTQMTTSANGINQFGYDGLYRLTSWTPSSGQLSQWFCDAVGNRTKVVSSAGTTNYSYDAADELLSAGTSSFTYEGNGNQITKTTAGSVVNYGWDALNRLTSVVGGAVDTVYAYDGDGNRVSQQTPAGTYAYVNDTNSSLPTVLNENGPDGVLDYLNGISIISATAAGFQYYHQQDGIGSTINLTDATGVQKANYSYDPWGKLTTPLDPVGSKDKYKFTSEAVDSSSALLFLRARYYDPSVGRFISRDPFPMSLALPRMSNRYQYALSNPVELTDPSGLSSIDGNQGSGEVLGTRTDTPNNALVTLATNTLVAGSEEVSFFPALLEEYLQSLGADLAAKAAGAFGLQRTSQSIQDVNTLFTPLAPSNQVGPASFRLADVIVPIVIWPVKAFFNVLNWSLK